MEEPHGSHLISDDPARLDVTAIHASLSRTYWSKNIPRATIERAIQGSLCVGAYNASGAQIGLVRLISDYVTFCYVCDVYVLEEYRGQGLAEGDDGFRRPTSKIARPPPLESGHSRRTRPVRAVWFQSCDPSRTLHGEIESRRLSRQPRAGQLNRPMGLLAPRDLGGTKVLPPEMIGHLARQSDFVHLALGIQRRFDATEHLPIVYS